MGFFNLIWPFMFLYGRLWSFMAFYGHIIVFYGLSMQNIELIGLVSSFLAVIDPNSFGLVLIKLAKKAQLF